LYPPYPITEHHHSENLLNLASRAVEGDAYHAAIEVAQADVSITLAAANTTVDKAVSFAKPFAAAPTVMVSITSAGNAGTYLNALVVSVTTSGFTIRAASGAAQTITCRWLAYGRRE
jgi:hypothetical protein